MNSDTDEELLQIAKQAGAITECPHCGNYDVRAYDDEAERRAYAMLTNTLKSGAYVRGFRGEDRATLLGAMKSTIEDANEKCPGGC